MLDVRQLDRNNFTLFAYRKKFGWLTFSVNLFSYLCFIIPLTALAVHERNQEQVLCGNTTTIAVDVVLKYNPKDKTSQI